MTPTTPPRPARSSRLWLVWMVMGAVVLCGLLALGTWQVRRLAWKTDLIAQVERLASASPTAPPGPAAWDTLTRPHDEYRRVSVRGTYSHEREILVQAVTDLGGGHWVLTPLFSDQGFWVWVNRGFVPPQQRDRAQRRASEPQGLQSVTALVRWSEPRGAFLQTNDAGSGRWFSRDVAAMAAAQGLTGAPLAPYFLDATGDSSGGAANPSWPRPGLTVLTFTNNHLVYALTWFALAAMVAAAMVYLFRQEMRQRGAPQSRHDAA